MSNNFNYNQLRALNTSLVLTETRFLVYVRSIGQKLSNLLIFRCFNSSTMATYGFMASYEE